MKKALALIEKCLSSLDPILDLSNCGLNSEDLDLINPLGSTLSQCTHLTKLTLSNETRHWNLNETTVLLTNGEYLYKGRPEFWRESQPRSRSETALHYFSIPNYRPRIETNIKDGYGNLFDTIPYVVQHLENLEELECGGSNKERWKIKSLQPLRRLSKLKTLVLSNNDIENVDCLDYFPDLEKLDLSNNRIVSLAGMTAHKGLKALDLSGNLLSNAGDIGKFPFLQWLDLSSNKLQSMDRLDELSLLQFLDLSCNSIVSFKPFKKRSLLRVFNMSENYLGQVHELGNLPKLKYLYFRRNRIDNITGIKDLKQLELLDLSHNMIDHLPEPFNSLSALRVLDVSGNALKVLDNITGLQQLKILNASNNHIHSILFEGPLAALEDLILINNNLSTLSIFPWCPNIQKLFVSENDIEMVVGQAPPSLSILVLYKNKISNLNFIRRCEQLTYLDASNNRLAALEQKGYYPKLSSLYAESNVIEGRVNLQNCPGLINVDLSLNVIKEIAGIKDLLQLEIIHLHYNVIKDLGVWENLPGLRRIGLQSNRLKVLPEGFSQLPELTDINASYNKIAQLPDVALFPKIERLNLSWNKIAVLRTFEPHPTLQQLSLSTNRITSLPDIYAVLKFPELDLSYNPITTVNNFTRSIKRDKELEITGDLSGTLKISWKERHLLLNGHYFDVPRQILNDDSLSIKNWFIARAEGGFINLEAKCILFGNGETGKTTLSHYLRTGEFYAVNNRTHGILIDSWRVERHAWKEQFGTSVSEAIEAADLNGPFTFNIWDFGGQEFYHATHRLFMSTDVLYLVLWEKESDFQDEEKGIFPKEYWVNNIQHYAAGSAVLLVQNRADKVFYVEADNCYKIGTYDQQSRKSVSRFHLDMQLLKEGILKRVSLLPHFGMYTPEVYQRIKEFLEKVKQPYISFGDFEDICREQDNTDAMIMSDSSQCESLLKYLDNIGSVVCFRHRERMRDSLMKEFVFTDPKWLTKVIYQILEKGKSEFDMVHVEKVVAVYSLPAELWINVMQNFGLIFEVRSKEGIKYIVPQYLPKECQNRSALELVLSCKNMVHAFTVSYPRFMPGSNFLRLISNYGSEHLEYLYWKRGLVFFRNGKTVFVECINNVNERKIRVSIQDLDGEVAVDVFETILDIDLSEDLEVSIDEVNYVQYALLKRKVTGGHVEVDTAKGETLATKDFNYLFKMEYSHLKKKVIRVFVSYSSKDKNLQELLIDGLRTHLVARSDYDFQIWSDKAIDMGADWNADIKENIRNADVAILLVSASFAASPYIRKEELEEFMEKMKGGSFLLLPVLVRSFDFMSFKELAGFQFFKAYHREYGFSSPAKRDKFMPFDVLAEDEKVEERWLNDYYKNLADMVYRSVKAKFYHYEVEE